MSSQRFPCLIRLYFLQMCVCILDRPEFHDHLRGGFFPHAGNTGNVIGSVSHQGFQLDDLKRCYLIFFFYLLCMKILDNCLAF